MIKSEQIVDAVHMLNKYRMEIVRIIAFIISIMILTYINSGYILDILAKPLKDLPLFFLTPMEGIMVKAEISIVTGIILSVPFISSRIVFLLSSKISRNSRMIFYFVIIPFAIIAFSIGVIFAYKFVIPPAIDFLITNGSEFMSPVISGSSYFSFIIIFITALGVIFELPLVFVILSRVGIVTYDFLSKKRKISILLIFIIAALITPTPDIFSLIIVAMPMVILYEISIWSIFILEKGKKTKLV